MLLLKRYIYSKTEVSQIGDNSRKHTEDKEDVKKIKGLQNKMIMHSADVIRAEFYGMFQSDVIIREHSLGIR